MLCMIFLRVIGSLYRCYVYHQYFPLQSLASFVCNKLWSKNCFSSQTHDVNSRKRLLVSFPVAPLARRFIFRPKHSSSVDNITTLVMTMFSREDKHACVAAIITMHVSKIASENWLSRDLPDWLFKEYNHSYHFLNGKPHGDYWDTPALSYFKSSRLSWLLTFLSPIIWEALLLLTECRTKMYSSPPPSFSNPSFSSPLPSSSSSFCSSSSSASSSSSDLPLLLFDFVCFAFSVFFAFCFFAPFFESFSFSFSLSSDAS